ncbi:uncharacterized protein LOC129695898 isoform X2 [Leucoraja erinacea]|uniref:uncharacterized protein LOC129695898 isoform X2 n=1 Tax=Leucoraja erinaceus TaxID=7782 RepID=UPI002456AF05|nr:uncharacterized protein LOC129695898 isoform X2 [Leucoraja erinacea]
MVQISVAASPPYFRHQDQVNWISLSKLFLKNKLPVCALDSQPPPFPAFQLKTNWVPESQVRGRENPNQLLPLLIIIHLKYFVTLSRKSLGGVHWLQEKLTYQLMAGISHSPVNDVKDECSNSHKCRSFQDHPCNEDTSTALQTDMNLLAQVEWLIAKMVTSLCVPCLFLFCCFNLNISTHGERMKFAGCLSCKQPELIIDGLNMADAGRMSPELKSLSKKG